MRTRRSQQIWVQPSTGAFDRASTTMTATIDAPSTTAMIPISSQVHHGGRCRTFGRCPRDHHTHEGYLLSRCEDDSISHQHSSANGLPHSRSLEANWRSKTCSRRKAWLPQGVGFQRYSGKLADFESLLFLTEPAVPRSICHSPQRYVS